DRCVSGTVDPLYACRDYRSTEWRAPEMAPLRIPYGPAELSGPSGRALVAGREDENPADLTRQHAGEPLGERIIVHGSVKDAAGRPLSDALVEIWQTNAAGRYAHAQDRHRAPLDPNFTGGGFCVTD